MFEDILIDQNPHWAKKIPDNTIKREQFSYVQQLLDTPHVIAITGIRRCGKSTLLKQTIHHLIDARNIPAENILFLNLEQPFLLQYSEDINNLEKIFQDYMTLHNPKGRLYLFIDEIQFFRHWPVFVKAHYEKKNIKFIITGSNSSLLSSDMVTLLSGRAIPVELYPLSLSERLHTKNIKHENTTQQITAKHQITKLLKQMLTTGGFPEMLEPANEKLYTDILSSYAKTILLQDIAPRLNIRKPKQLEELFTYLATNISAVTSYHKLSNHFSLSDKSIKEYIHAFSDAYLLFELEKFSYSTKPQHKILKKIYTIDCGIANACGFRFSPNNGKLLENTIFIDCKRRGIETYFYKTNNDLEVDFIIKHHSKTIPLQVTWELGKKETFLRETRALSAALDELNLTQGIIISMDEKITFDTEDQRILHVAAYQWLLRKDAI